MNQLSQLPDECTVDTLYSKLSYQHNFSKDPETSQNLPKKPKRSTPMTFSCEVQRLVEIEDLCKQPLKPTPQHPLKRRTLIEHRTQPKQQVNVVVREDFKYCRKSLQLTNNSATQQKQEKLEDRIHRYSQSKRREAQTAQASKLPSQLEQICEDQTEVDDEQEAFFQRNNSKFHYYLKKAKNIKSSIKHIALIGKFGTLEMCLGLEDNKDVTYFRRDNQIIAKIY